MYNQKVTKPKQQKWISCPNLDYINIYEKTVRRMTCFPKLDIESKDEDDFYGTATQYDTYLDKQLKTCSSNPELDNGESFSLQVDFKQLNLAAATFVPVSQ